MCIQGPASLMQAGPAQEGRLVAHNQRLCDCCCHKRQGNWSSIVQILDRLTEDYAYSPQANCRKGGLLALAAAAVALAERKQVHDFCLACCCSYERLHAHVPDNYVSSQCALKQSLSCMHVVPLSTQYSEAINGTMNAFPFAICRLTQDKKKRGEEWMGPDYLAMVVPPVLNSLVDADARVRYYACEALYNIAKAGC